MRRRVEESGVSVPPPGLVDYKRWCADRGLTPFGVGGDVVSLRAAYAQWVIWEEQRREWAAARGVDEDAPVLDWHGSAPFDPDVL
jgi:hypothetical protein